MPLLFHDSRFVVSAASMAFALHALLAPAQAFGVAPLSPIAARTTVYVRFERLSPVVQTAEAQKDMLLQVLRDTHSASAVYLEWSDGEAQGDGLGEVGKRYVVRCLVCATPRPGDAFLATSLETTQVSARPRRDRLRFHVGPDVAGNLGNENAAESPSARTTGTTGTNWSVEIEERRPVFVVRAAKDVSTGEDLSAASANVEKCYESSACQGDVAFSSEADASTFHLSLQGRQATRAFRLGAPLASRDTRPAILVRTGDALRLSVRTAAPGLFIRTSARALQSGAAGESINVEMNGTDGRTRSRQVRAVVSGRGEVEYALE